MSARAAGPQGPVPKMADGKPDLSGVWFSPRTVDPGKPAMLPWAAALTKERTENHSKGDPESQCLPAGVPRMNPFPWKIVQTPTVLVMLFEGNIHTYRQIFLDQEHPKDLDPTWYGHSTGKWDGDTLVIDTIGFNDKFWFDFAGHPHTEQLHVIERFRRRDLRQSRYGHHHRRSGRVYRTVEDQADFAADGEGRNSGIHLQREQPGRRAHRREIGEKTGVFVKNFFPS